MKSKNIVTFPLLGHALRLILVHSDSFTVHCVLKEAAGERGSPVAVSSA